MESRLSRYFLIVGLIFILALLVDHYQGRWFRLVLGDTWDRLQQSTFAMCDEHQWQWCATPSLTRLLHASPGNNDLGMDDVPLRQYEMHSKAVVGCDNLTVTQALQAQSQNRGIYTWQDEHGVTHFSDVENKVATSQITQYIEPKYNFELHIESLGTSPPPFFRDKLTSTINKIDRIYRQYLPKRELQPIKVNLVLAGNLTAYRKLRDQYASSVGASQGFYTSQHNIAAVWFRESNQTFSTAIHETVHVMNAGQFGNTPRWFNEGMAEYFESDAFLASVDTNKRYKTMVEQNAATKPKYRFVDVSSPLYMGLEELLNATDNEWQGPKQAALYQHSQSFIRFLFSTRSGKTTLAGLVADFSKNRCQTKLVDTVFARYPGGAKRLNQDWLSWRKRSI